MSDWLRNLQLGIFIICSLFHVVFTIVLSFIKRCCIQCFDSEDFHGEVIWFFIDIVECIAIPVSVIQLIAAVDFVDNDFD